MRDPLLIIEPLPLTEYYEARPEPPGGWKPRTEPTVESENRLHTNVRNLIIEKDRLIEQGNANAKELKRERQWRKFLIASLIATWTAFGTVVKVLLPYLVKGFIAK